MRLLLIGLGGGVGSILRYVVGGLVQTDAGSSPFPTGTLAVNLLGCLAIGALAELSESRSILTIETRALLMTGLIGGFTTFSAFANETVIAVRENALLIATTNILLSVSLGLAAVWLGRCLAHMMWG